MECEASSSRDPKGKKAVRFSPALEVDQGFGKWEDQYVEEQTISGQLAWRRQHQTSSIRGFICATIIFVVFVGALSYIYQPAVNKRRLDTIQTNQTPTLQCSNPPIRREWRGLTVDEKEDFTRSVNCLSRVPSTWGLNGTLYDDFSALHGGIGSWSHRSSSFLPWHRNALHVWETALREHCGFSGQIPYWDWTMDWMNLANSSMWDNTEGFGGDGQVGGPTTVGEGRCVVDGPFADLRPIKYNHTYVQHCLSRGFRDNGTLGHISGLPFRPEIIGEVRRKKTYVEFEEAIEMHLHNAMHLGISGDFLSLTAANDPIFYVHHAQMDHLWWQWQQEDLQKRLIEYNGKHMHNSTGQDAGLDSMLVYGGFTDDIPVSHVMNTEGGKLCYRY
ncbi:putative tyrosinase [Diaporthe sp. PMI_573]|nr:putative tyrosinase [Diaporthaceae sp. PMI_573]